MQGTGDAKGINFLEGRNKKTGEWKCRKVDPSASAQGEDEGLAFAKILQKRRGRILLM